MHASATLKTIYNLVPFFCHQSNRITNCQLVLYRITTLYHIISPFLHSMVLPCRRPLARCWRNPARRVAKRTSTGGIPKKCTSRCPVDSHGMANPFWKISEKIFDMSRGLKTSDEHLLRLHGRPLQGLLGASSFVTSVSEHLFENVNTWFSVNVFQVHGC